MVLINLLQFSVPYNGHFVDHKQSHCRGVVRYSQSENTAVINREELTNVIHSLTGVIAIFQHLVSDMRYGDNT